MYYERHYRAEEALEVYQKMVRHYPKTLAAHAGRIRVLETMLDDYQEAQVWRVKAERLFDVHALNAAVDKTAQQLHDERPIKLAGLITEDGLTLPSAPTVSD